MSATRMRESDPLRGYVAVFLGRVDNLLGSELLKGADDAETGVARFDHIVDIAVAGCVVGVAEEFVVFVFFLAEHLGGIVGCLCFLA